jgi:hypothetical protein
MRRLAVLLAAALAVAPCAGGAQTLPTTNDRIVLPQLAEDDITFLVAKNAAYVGLLNAAARGRDSYNRYVSWVSLKTGPTGKERIIYGLYSVSPEVAGRAIEKARDAARKPPAVPDYDAAALKLAGTLEALIPTLNEAEAYYERQDYKDDRMQEGRALHARLIPLFNDFLVARARLESGFADVRQGLDEQILAKIEAKEGQSYRWHRKRVMMAAAKAIDVLPRESTQKDIRAYEAAVAEFAKVVREFDSFAAGVTDKGAAAAFDSQPRSLLGDMRDLRDKAGKGEQQVFYAMSVSKVVNAYNMMTTMATMFGN